jgi:hypothetical protein
VAGKDLSVRYCLGSFILMVREDEVLAAAVKIEGLTKQG